MATNFLIGKGAVFSISTDGTTFTPVKQLKTIQFSGAKSDYEDITNLDSAGATREWAPTLLDSGQASISGVFDPVDPGQEALSAAFLAQTKVSCKLQFAKASDETTTGMLRTFSGYISERTLDAQFDKSSTITATVKITGVITDTFGS